MSEDLHVLIKDADLRSYNDMIHRTGVSDGASDFGSEDLDANLSDNKNTKRKTETDMRIFAAHLLTVNEFREPDKIPPVILDQYLTTFFSVIKKHDGNEYEPASLRGMLCSIERYLRQRQYPASLTRDAAFVNTRNMLKEKQLLLRQMAKTVKKTKHESLTTCAQDRLKQLYNAKEFGPYSPMSVINSLCFVFVIHLKIRRAVDHKQLLWGDIALKKVNDQEFLCYEPVAGYLYLRQPLNGISQHRIYSQTTDGALCDPIALYKLYARKRPSQTMRLDSPFFLGVSMPTSTTCALQHWFKTTPMGVNKLNDLVRMIRDIIGTLAQHTSQDEYALVSYDKAQTTNGETMADGAAILNTYSVLPSRQSGYSQSLEPCYVTNEQDGGQHSISDDHHRATSAADGCPDDQIVNGQKDIIKGVLQDADISNLQSGYNEAANSTQDTTDDDIVETDKAKEGIKAILDRLGQRAKRDVAAWLLTLLPNEMLRCNVSFALDSSEVLRQQPFNVSANIQMTQCNATDDDATEETPVNDKKSNHIGDLDDAITDHSEHTSEIPDSPKALVNTEPFEGSPVQESNSAKRTINSDDLDSKSKFPKLSLDEATQQHIKPLKSTANYESIADLQRQRAELTYTEVMSANGKYYPIMHAPTSPTALQPDLPSMYQPWTIDPRLAMLVRHGILPRYHDIGGFIPVSTKENTE